ncbi:MAG: hypothetical protein R3B68_14165 [Phycisphaerales bacterium]
MSPRLRFGLWVAAVAGCGLSPVLFRLVAPWAGAAWQCLCLGGILALYATTPVDAIKLPAWLSRAIIVGGMVLWPWLCYGRVTPALLIPALVAALFDHVPLTMTRKGAPKPGVHIEARWSWKPGVLADWATATMLWSPMMWFMLAGSRAQHEEMRWAFGGSLLALLWMFVLQLPSERSKHWPRATPRVGIPVVFFLFHAYAAIAYAIDPGL